MQLPQQQQPIHPQRHHYQPLVPVYGSHSHPVSIESDIPYTELWGELIDHLCHSQSKSDTRCCPIDIHLWGLSASLADRSRRRRSRAWQERGEFEINTLSSAGWGLVFKRADLESWKPGGVNFFRKIFVLKTM